MLLKPEYGKPTKEKIEYYQNKCFDLASTKTEIIDVKDLAIERWFYFVSRTGYQSDLMTKFEKYTLNNYNF